MKKNLRNILLVLCLAAFCVSLFGCASKEAYEPYPNDFRDEDMPYSEQYSYSGKTDYGTDVQFPSEAEKPQGDTSRKIIRIVTLSCETKEFDKVLAQIVTDVRAFGGYFETMDLSSNYRNARRETMVIRIPKPYADEFLSGVKGAVNILRESESNSDVTLKYADVESKLAALNVQQTRLLELMEQAKNLDEILTLEDKLADVRYQLERYESERRLMENQVEYVTVNMSLNEVEKETVTEAPTLGSRMGEGFMECIKRMGEVGSDILVFLASAAPALIVLAIIVLAIVLPISHSRKKKKAAKAAAAEKTEE